MAHDHAPTPPGGRRAASDVRPWSLAAAACRARLGQPAWDAFALACAVVLAALLRFDFDVVSIDAAGLVVFLPLAAAAQTLSGIKFGLYTGRWRYGSFEEMWALAPAVLCATAVLVVLDALLGRLVPLSVALGGGLIGLLLMSGSRLVVRLRAERRLRPSTDRAQRVVVMGAGEGGAQVVAAMLRSPSSPYIPVALLDDDRAKRRLRIMGVPVVGTRADMAAAVNTTHADAVLIAIPSAPGRLIREVTDVATGLGVRVKVLPPVGELFGAPPQVDDIRPVSHADLLGRRELDIDVSAIASYLKGHRILVTGAGGSIGSELCRQVARVGPEALIMLDRDESGLQAVELSLDGRGLLEDENLVVADIRDSARLDDIFETHRPDVVFHAAALKHLPLLEMHPSEAVKTNVLATQELLEVATSYGVSRFINISTDKAADPTSVLGYSKRITERLTAAAALASPGGRAYLSVRFGNVLGSRGSVLTAFQSQIAAGGPLTVTHPDVTRFFMTVEEAVQLVIQAGAVGRAGEVLVLDMGEPVRIASVAERLAAMSDRRINIVYTGLRQGEKLHEILRGKGEPDERPLHPLISHIAVPPLHASALSLLTPASPDATTVAMLRWLAESPALAGLGLGPSRSRSDPIVAGDRLPVQRAARGDEAAQPGKQPPSGGPHGHAPSPAWSTGGPRGA
jgi:FlaA1/EpsC-like NDP-sugar epimerase